LNWSEIIIEGLAALAAVAGAIAALLNWLRQRKRREKDPDAPPSTRNSAHYRLPIRGGRDVNIIDSFNQRGDGDGR
jgi:hypothetical protein